MRLSAVVVCVLLLALPALAVGKTPLPPVGELGDTRAFMCGEQLVELRFYDFDPPDNEKWQAVGLGLTGEPDFFRVYTNSDENKAFVFIDADRDGYAETVYPWPQARDKYVTWCGAYEQIRK